jgi:putative transposase
MDFSTGQIYHVFNRSNNSQLVFPERGNYIYFLSKINEYVKPYAQILAWCLMPTHFHLMIDVLNVSIELSDPVDDTSDPMTGTTDPMTRVHRIRNTVDEDPTHPMNSSHRMSPPQTAKVRTLNDSIAIMLRSYTRAINKQSGIHGSLFQQHTKAVCLTEPEFVPAYFTTHFGMLGNISLHEAEYLNVCFNYIHMNPVNDGLVLNPEDWEFSSYRDYYGGRKGKLINRELTKELGLTD